MKKFAAVLITVPIILAGCASGGGSAPNLPAVQQTVRTVVSIPPINTEASAEIGQTIISKANVSKTPAITLASDYTESVNPPGSTTVKAGTHPLLAEDATGKFYSDGNALYNFLGSSVPARAGIFVPADKAKPAVIYHYAMYYKFGEKPLAVEATTKEDWGKDSFIRELVYSGVSGNTISILYREFIDNRARPAFTQDLKYDLAQGKTIGYKGARFEVIKATNTDLQYKVVKALD